MVYISLAREEKCVQNLTKISITLERPINNKQITPTRKNCSRCQLSKLATVMYRVSDQLIMVVNKQSPATKHNNFSIG